jgi:geranylgeranyl diphosphate synthase type I
MSKESLSGFLGYWLPKLEHEMREVLRYPALEKTQPDVTPLFGMMQYHMGWTDMQFHPEQHPSGKRLRPMFCLLACAEVGGEPGDALPAAAGLELLHNFSLIHDDIEDGDEVRRHRPTMWKVWGVPQAVNSGDSMFALSYAAIQRLPSRGVSAQTTLRVLDVFTNMCVMLTEGQYLDLEFEERSEVKVQEYVRMISGKTAALIGASIAIGAIIGGATDEQVDALQRFGRSIGLAFQIQDDYLGIWGDPEVTGKPAGNDILRRKKSLPLLYALDHPEVGSEMRTLWQKPLQEADLQAMMALLERAGAQAFVEERLLRYHREATRTLHQALGPRADESVLLALMETLLHRRS